MAALLTITLLLLCCSAATSTASQAKCDYKAAKGDDLNIPLDRELPLKDLRRIEWEHNGNKVSTFRVNNGVIHPLTENSSLDGSLTLTKVDQTKAGTYTLNVFDTQGKATTKTKTLCVFDRVTKPSVMVKCLKSPASKVKSSKDTTSDQVEFTCKTAQGDLQIQWLKNKQVMKDEKGHSLKQDVQKVERDSFSCSVSNPVSSAVSDPVTQTCVQSKLNFLFDKVLGLPMWIFIAIGGGVVLLLILTVIICCIKQKRKRHMHLKDEEELRLEWTNTEQPQHQHHSHNHKHHHHNHPTDHHHHHHQHQQQQQPAGHTGPRQHRSRPQRDPRPRAPEVPGNHPQPSPRRPAQQGSGPAVNHDDEQPPPLPQPRKKAAM